MNVHHDLPHWNYFRLLERDLEHCFEYVTPKAEHFNVFSDQFARVILMASSEIENALAAISFWTFQTSQPKNIKSFQALVSQRFPRFVEMELIMPRYSLAITPWREWTQKTPPDWWSNGYNKIKHDRVNHPEAPTLIRAINAVGGLLVTLLHLYRVRFKDCLMPEELRPALLVLWNRDDPYLGATAGWGWELPDEMSNPSFQRTAVPPLN